MQLSRLISLALAGSATAAPLTDVLAANADQLSTLTATLATIPTAAQGLNTLANITVFAPSNDAFRQLMMQNPNFTQMAANTTALTQFLLYHAVPLVMPARSFNTTPMFMPTLLGATTGATTQYLGMQLMNNMAMVISGFKQMSVVTKADILFDGGVLHIIDRVLTLPGPPSLTGLETGMTSFYGALVKTGMVSAVDALPPGTTVFVPNNIAFEAVGSAVEAASTTDLMGVLSYHVVKAGMTGMPAFSPMLMGMGGMAGMVGMGGAGTHMRRHEVVTMSLPTLQGGNLTVRLDADNGELFINSAKVVVSDIITSNGVIHVIDNVLNPMAAAAVPNPTAMSQTPAFAGATPVQAAPFTSGISAATLYTPATMSAAMTMAAGAGPFAAMPTAALVAGGAAAMLANL